MSGPTSPRGNPPSGDRRIRYTLDLAHGQHRFLRLFALDAGVDASVVVRTLLSLLEEDGKLARRVLQRVEARS